MEMKARGASILVLCEEGDEEKLKGSLSIYGFYIDMAFATLTKGPVGFILLSG
jgi:hypothetical protein